VRKIHNGGSSGGAPALRTLTWHTTRPNDLLAFALCRARSWKTLAAHYCSRSKDEMRRTRRCRKKRALHRWLNEIAPTRSHIIGLGTGFSGSKYTPKGRRYTCMNREMRAFLVRHRIVIPVCEWGTSSMCPR
jgi:hypothetical protein